MWFSRGSTLVLQKFDIAVAPVPPAVPTVEIVGRAQGFFAFLLSLLGLSPVTRFLIAGTELRCQSSSLFGERMQFIPLRCVSNITAGVHKPISALFVALVVFLTSIYIAASDEGAPEAFFIGAGMSVVLLFVYFLSKRFYIEVHAMGGDPISLVFKPNVIEGVPINIERALMVVAVIRDLVVSHGEAGGGTYSAAAAGFAAEPVWEEAGDDPAAQMYARARRYVQKGERQQALDLLEILIRKYPQSEAAEKARRALEQQRGEI